MSKTQEDPALQIKTDEPRRLNMIEAINEALDTMMERDPDVVIMGEDVGYFGGVFRATAGLQEKHGKSRVFDTPISECGIIGAAVGMGAYGLRPVPGNPVRRLHLSRPGSAYQRGGRGCAIVRPPTISRR